MDQLSHWSIASDMIIVSCKGLSSLCDYRSVSIMSSCIAVNISYISPFDLMFSVDLSRISSARLTEPLVREKYYNYTLGR